MADVLRVKWPESWKDDDPRTRDAIDFTKLGAANLSTLSDGRMLLQLSSPFADVVIVSGETMPESTALRLLQAAVHFDAIIASQLKGF